MEMWGKGKIIRDCVRLPRTVWKKGKISLNDNGDYA